MIRYNQLDHTVDSLDKEDRPYFIALFDAVGRKFDQKATKEKGWQITSRWSWREKNMFVEWMARSKTNDGFDARDAQESACHFTHKFGWKTV